jgi:hypothetical protein
MTKREQERLIKLMLDGAAADYLKEHGRPLGSPYKGDENEKQLPSS